MKRIKYICYYHGIDDKKPRFAVPAATTKIDYIISVLNRIGYSVDIISNSGVSSNGFNISFGGKQPLDNENSVRYFFSFGCAKYKILQYFSGYLQRLHFYCWLLSNLSKGERVIVYHSLGYCSLFQKLAMKKQLDIIGEIEEIYQDVHTFSKAKSKSEYDFFSVCSKFIFPNTVLNSKVNIANKPALVVHGIYNVQPFVSEHFNDDKIHVLYSGTFDVVKGGALAAIEAAYYLGENYQIHITGFGNNRDIKNLEKKIEDLPCEMKDRVLFHGYLSTEDLIALMQGCHIGLCTQDPTKILNLTSFPSKILFYLSNGLAVLTGRNRAIEESKVSDLLYYYEEQTPQSIAASIKNIDGNNVIDGKERLRQLDIQFENELKSLLTNNK